MEKILVIFFENGLSAMLILIGNIGPSISMRSSVVALLHVLKSM